MCIEDIRIGRQSPSRPRTVAVGSGGGSVQIAPANPRRTRLIVMGVRTDTLTVAPEGIDSALTAGVQITPTTPLQVLKIEDWGVILTGPWNAEYLASPGTAIVIDVETERE